MAIHDEHDIIRHSRVTLRGPESTIRMQFGAILHVQWWMRMIFRRGEVLC